MTWFDIIVLIAQIVIVLFISNTKKHSLSCQRVVCFIELLFNFKALNVHFSRDSINCLSKIAL